MFFPTPNGPTTGRWGNKYSIVLWPASIIPITI
jgi:hypothetical protein